MIWPFVINWAMPRPATIRMRVATIGWILTLETRNPFHRPHSVPATSEASTMMPSGVFVSSFVRISFVISCCWRIGLSGGQGRKGRGAGLGTGFLLPPGEEPRQIHGDGRQNML